MIREKIAGLIGKDKAIKQEKENYERGQLIAENFERKKLNANERELFSREEEARKKLLKEELARIRLEEDRRFWSGKVGNPLNTPNVISNHQNLFANNDNLFMKKGMFLR